jgi:methylmalonyl-CoA mutase N-terminal domain/subunit
MSFSTEDLAAVIQERASWTTEELAQALARMPLRKKEFQTDSGIPIPDVVDAAVRPGAD